VPKRKFLFDGVLIVPPYLFFVHVTRLFQICDDALDGAFGDSNEEGDLTEG
jgi:hypothetical protein